MAFLVTEYAKIFEQWSPILEQLINIRSKHTSSSNNRSYYAAILYFAFVLKLIVSTTPSIYLFIYYLPVYEFMHLLISIIGFFLC